MLPYRFCLVLLGAISKYKSPGAYIRTGDLTEGFLRYDFGVLIFGRAYFRNFTVLDWAIIIIIREFVSKFTTNIVC